MKSIVTFILLSILSSSGIADEISDEMSKRGYIESEVPEVGSEEWSLANRSFPSRHVALDESLVISSDDEEQTNLVFDAGTVKYVGIDHGEFGGGLYLNEYKQNEKPFFSANIRALVPINGDLYIISGLAHMSFSGGAIHVIRDYRNPSTPIQITLLPDAPEAITIEDSWRGAKKIVIAGHSSLMEFTPDTDFEIVVFNAFWGSLYPTSIVQYKKSYYIGIRSGVAVVTPEFGRAKVRYFVAK
ncbi:hypothetical protein [Pseudoalteromonas piscicida]|uniref:Uncharacterized protein n=1 Tax=Pseudoalteromonas piscicida TaxID=43662 RepID=A0AAD0W5R0_PSEO7|nr:hypothetical protein [Pseudoalteromonas piscicida]ASD66098.1 hypothetical protein B1L02_02955 [Pseudoalteromonas piscicida]AXR03198.1 hypothetical protein D0511_14805 [Pseudoalteromonas piscicida]